MSDKERSPRLSPQVPRIFVVANKSLLSEGIVQLLRQSHQWEVLFINSSNKWLLFALIRILHPSHVVAGQGSPPALEELLQLTQGYAQDIYIIKLDQLHDDVAMLSTGSGKTVIYPDLATALARSRDKKKDASSSAAEIPSGYMNH